MRHVVGSFLIFALLLTGCATTSTGAGPKNTTTAERGDQHPLKEWMSQQSRAKKKGIVGALVGAVAGAATAAITGRDPWAGAAVGAVAGGLAGFLVGKRQDKLFGSRDEAVRKLDYDPSQGYVMEVDEISFEPANPEPGDEVVMTVRYLVVGPDPKENLTVESLTGVKYDGEFVMGDGPADFVVERGGGIVESTITLTLPKDAPNGTYALVAVLEDPQGRYGSDGESALYLG